MYKVTSYEKELIGKIIKNYHMSDLNVLGNLLEDEFQEAHCSIDYDSQVVYLHLHSTPINNIDLQQEIFYYKDILLASTSLIHRLVADGYLLSEYIVREGSNKIKEFGNVLTDNGLKYPIPDKQLSEAVIDLMNKRLVPQDTLEQLVNDSFRTVDDIYYENLIQLEKDKVTEADKSSRKSHIISILSLSLGTLISIVGMVIGSIGTTKVEIVKSVDFQTSTPMLPQRTDTLSIQVKAKQELVKSKTIIQNQTVK